MLNPNTFLKTTALVTTVFGPVGAFAEAIDVTTQVAAATIYPMGAEVERRVSVSLPAGDHVISFADIPALSGEIEEATLNVTLGDLEVGGSTLRYLPSQEPKTEAYIAAKRAFDDAIAARDQIRLKKRGFEDQIQAAGDTLAFLQALKAGDQPTAQSLAEIAAMIAEQSAQARSTVATAEQSIERMKEEITAAQKAVSAARASLDALFDADQNHLGVSFPVSVSAAHEVELVVTYMTDEVSWKPLYSAHLDTVKESFVLDRQVNVSQATGEGWTDVALTFSTDQPSYDPDPRNVGARIRRIFEPVEQKQLMRTMAAPSFNDAVEPTIEAAVIVEEAAVAEQYGVALAYTLPGRVNLATGYDQSTFTLSTVDDIAPEIFVRAVPLYEDKGYLMARLINTTGETWLAGAITLKRDGGLGGFGTMQTLADGGELELGFGALNGITVDRVTVARNEGDRGLISKSNEQESAVRLEVENLTGRTWAMEVVDRISITEQEDLEIEWSSSTAPSEEGVDNKRGVLAWRFDLAAGANWDTTLTEALTWPEGQHLQ